MTDIKDKDYTGFSELSIDDAVLDALKKAGKHERVEVIETRSSQQLKKKSEYHVTLTTSD